MTKKRRVHLHHGETFVTGDAVFFIGSGEGPYPVVSVCEIPEVDEWGGNPRDGVCHHQHVTIQLNDSDGTGVSCHVYSGAWLSHSKDTSPEENGK